MSTPIYNYGGTNIGSPSGWQRRYTAEFSSATGKAYRVEIIDSKGGDGGFDFAHPTTGTPTRTAPMLLGPDGVTISYDGSSDNTHDTFLHSKLTLDMVVEGSYHRELFQKIKLTEEGRFGVVLFRHEPSGSSSDSLTTSGDITGEWRIEWVGVLQPEGTEFVDHEVNELLRLTFTDGMAGLNERLYSDANNNLITGRQTILGIVASCLAKIPTSTIFGYDWGVSSAAETLSTSSPAPFLEEEVYYFTNKHDSTTAGSRSMLSNVAVEQGGFSSIERVTDELGGDFVRTEFVSCAEVLKNCLAAFRLRICMANGRFVISNPTALTLTSTRHVFAYPAHVFTYSMNTQGTFHTQADKTVPFARNNSHQYIPTKGFGTSFLYPVRTCKSTHIKGGSHALLTGQQSSFNVPGWNGANESVYRVKHHTETATTLTNPTALVDGDDGGLFMSFHCAFSSIGWYYGSSDILNDQFRGCKIMLRMVIKVGNYYLNRDLVTSNDHVDIDIPGAGNNIEYRDWSQSGAVTWTTTPSTYDTICPFIGCDPEPPVVLQGSQNDVQRVGGYHLKLQNEDEFRFKNGFISNGTLQNNSKFDLNWALPPLPGGIIHEGVEFSAKATYFNSNNNQIQGNDITEGIGWSGLNQCMLWTDFGIYASDFEEDKDVNFYATNTLANNTARICVAESILGDEYAQANARTLQHRDPSVVNPPWSYCDQVWASMNDPLNFRFLHKLNAEEGIRERRQPLTLFKGSIVTNISDFARPPWNGFTATYDYVPPIRPYNLINYEVQEGNNTVEKFAYPLSLTWTVRSNSFEGVWCLKDQDWTFNPTFTDDKDDKFPLPTGTGGLGSVVFTGTKGDHSFGGAGETTTDTTLQVKGTALTAFNTSESNATAVARFRNVAGSPSEERVVYVDTNGDMDDLADGTAGQFLRTTGTGSLEWATVRTGGGFQWARSGKVAATTGRGFYFARNNDGWMGSPWDLNVSSTSSMNSRQFYGAFIAPAGATTMNFGGVFSALTVTHQINVSVSYGTPGGATISLTQIANQNITPTSVNRPMTVSLGGINLGIQKGDYIFVFFYRDGATLTTADYIFNFVASFS